MMRWAKARKQCDSPRRNHEDILHEMDWFIQATPPPLLDMLGHECVHERHLFCATAAPLGLSVLLGKPRRMSRAAAPKCVSTPRTCSYAINRPLLQISNSKYCT